MPEAEIYLYKNKSIGGTHNMTEQNGTTDHKYWIEGELSMIPTKNEYIKVPSLKFEEENRIYEIEVDFSKPFEKYLTKDDKGKDIAKAIIPVKFQGQDRVWWLNKKNPCFRELLDGGKLGKTKFKVMRQGTAQQTKYILIKE